MTAGHGESGGPITGCKVDACMAEGEELVVAIDGDELEGRDADMVTAETFTSRDNIDTDGGAEEDSLLENVCDRNVELGSELS
jgi:hypothetical protein